MEHIIKTGGGHYLPRLSVTLANGKVFDIAPKIKTLTCDGKGYHIMRVRDDQGPATGNELARLREIIRENRDWLDS